MEIVRTYSKPYKRYCLTLDLKNDPELIAEYLKYSIKFGKTTARESIQNLDNNEIAKSILNVYKTVVKEC